MFSLGGQGIKESWMFNQGLGKKETREFASDVGQFLFPSLCPFDTSRCIPPNLDLYGKG